MRVFRDAIVECVKLERVRPTTSFSEKVPTFDVVGFASVSPMQSNDGTGRLSNCEVANRRADAVASFLTDEEKYKEKWACPEVGNNFKLAPKLCTGEEKVYERSLGGIEYRVRVRGWSDPEQMEDKKPADDGALPDDRRYRVELLNRAVHITVPENFCRALDSTVPGDGEAASSDETPVDPDAGGTVAGNEDAVGQT